MTEVKTQIKQRSKLKDKHDMWPNVWTCLAIHVRPHFLKMPSQKVCVRLETHWLHGVSVSAAWRVHF